jgi:hypothetical protein
MPQGRALSKLAQQTLARRRPRMPAAVQPHAEKGLRAQPALTGASSLPRFLCQAASLQQAASRGEPAGLAAEPSLCNFTLLLPVFSPLHPLGIIVGRSWA